MSALHHHNHPILRPKYTKPKYQSMKPKIYPNVDLPPSFIFLSCLIICLSLISKHFDEKNMLQFWRMVRGNGRYVSIKMMLLWHWIVSIV